MHNRKNLRLKNFEYNSAGAYFVTIVCRNRSHLFGQIIADKIIPTAIGSAVINSWEQLPVKYDRISTDAFVLMPNHLHAILWIQSGSDRTLSNIINFFKAGVTRNTGLKIWQRGYYDRVVRNENELMYIRKYIEENPLRWELDLLNLPGEHKCAPYKNAG